MLNYLDSEEEVLEVELDRLDVRDNLKLASDADTPMKRAKLQQIQQLEKFLTHWKAKVEDKVGLKAKKEVGLKVYFNEFQIMYNIIMLHELIVTLNNYYYYLCLKPQQLPRHTLAENHNNFSYVFLLESQVLFSHKMSFDKFFAGHFFSFSC